MRTATRERWYRGISLGLALGAHGLLLGGALLWRPAQDVTSQATAMSVVMVELDSAPSLPATPAPPPPPKPPQARQTPVPAPRALDEVLPESIPPEHSEPLALEPAPEISPDANTSALPQPDTAPAIQAAAQQAAPHTINAWQQQLLAHLQRYRRYPVQARRQRQQGIAHVRFSVNRQGQVSHPRIEQPSGHRLLDEETLATVHRANPVPPPPMEVTGNPVDVVVPVSFHLRRR